MMWIFTYVKKCKHLLIKSRTVHRGKQDADVLSWCKGVAMCPACSVSSGLLICTAELDQKRINEDGAPSDNQHSHSHTVVSAGNISQICGQLSCESQLRLEIFADFYCVKKGKSHLLGPW